MAIAFKLQPLPLTFAELESLARSSHAVLLAFLRAGIARQKSGLAQHRAQVAVEFDEGARDAEPQRAALPRDAPAGGRREHVELFPGLGEHEWLADNEAQRFGGEVGFERPVV